MIDLDKLPTWPPDADFTHAFAWTWLPGYLWPGARVQAEQRDAWIMLVGTFLHEISALTPAERDRYFANGSHPKRLLTVIPE